VFDFLTTAEDRQRYIAVLKRTLISGGHIIIAAFAPGGPTRCSGLDIVQYDAAMLMTELGPGFRLEEQQVEIHQTPAGKEQRLGTSACASSTEPEARIRKWWYEWTRTTDLSPIRDSLNLQSMEKHDLLFPTRTIRDQK
jgi:hypothetical protein